MKTILMTMTALAAVGLAAPASAQPWTGHQSQTASLQMQLDAGMRTGAISHREAFPLRRSLRDLITLERQFGRNGFSGSENAVLRQRSNELSRQIRFAERDGRPGGRTSGSDRDDRDSRDNHNSDGHDAWSRDRVSGSDRDKDGWNGRDGLSASVGIDPRFEQPNRGNRYAGDAQVGYHATTRMIALPDQYRDNFRDTADFYYRYDAGRIYRISRTSNMVLGLFDIQN